MKRSEMVELLANSWLKHDGDFGEQELEVADKVLRDLEKAGMLPPFVDGIKDRENYIKLVVDQAAYVGHCIWESQNE